MHQHAAGARKKYGKQAIGVSRGGKNTKIHALVTEYFQLIGLLLTGGQVHDSECATSLLNKVNLEGKTVLGDKAFCSARNVVERFFLRIKNRRRIATRFDKLAVCFLNFFFSLPSWFKSRVYQHALATEKVMPIARMSCSIQVPKILTMQKTQTAYWFVIRNPSL